MSGEAASAPPAAYSPLPFEALESLAGAPFAEPPPPSAPRWPMLVDPCAGACDPGTRSALADALGAVRAPWAEAILCQALEEEADPIVRAALVAARSPWWCG